MEKSADIARAIYDKQRDLLTEGMSPSEAQDVERAILPWIQAKLDQHDPDLYSKEEYVESVVPREISYQFEGLSADERYDKAVSTYDRLRVQLLNEETYERARHFLEQKGDPSQQKASAEADLKELKEIENRLSEQHPDIYKRLKRQISESKLDCLYVIRDGGAASLRLGREIHRRENSS